jgi:hypothetical protein
MAVIQAYFPFKANWEASIKTARRYHTSITTAISGIEMRAGLKDLLVRSQSFDVIAVNAYEANYLKWFLWKYLHQVIGVPWYVDQVELVAEAAALQATLQVTPVQYTEIVAQNEIMIVKRPRANMEFERGYVASISNQVGYDIITMNDNLVSTWPVRSLVFPVFPFTLQRAQKMDHVTSGVAKYRVEVVGAFED